MRWSDIPWRPPASTLRWFAAIWLIWFAALAGAAWFRGNQSAALALLGVAILVGLLGLLHPPAVRYAFVASLVLTFPIGWLVSRLLLGVVFYCVFTPLGLFFRLIGRDALGRHFKLDHGSYWSPKPEPKGLRDYFRMS
jgi:hypothetical protein